ncbi:MAG TPA: tRNA (N6-isopentenyl adenosine(37)-C2)-methylthiotransferase MiaB, partial [Alkalispirochaeta sp.]|nr:tRNA (N6-isopentenyl adenosine(37)-C2)-methylthiotransferase MiaB [Alkalispirochaeta sp.]
MRYHLVPLGCQMNQSDAERIRTVLERLGYERSEREEDADVLGVVACSVRQKAIDKVYSKIHKWNEWKNDRNVLTFVSGCMLPEDREKFLKRFDMVFTINELPGLPDMIRQYGVVTPTSL